MLHRDGLRRSRRWRNKRDQGGAGDEYANADRKSPLDRGVRSVCVLELAPVNERGVAR
jgi:hypothetical protein